jgi:hypothetical protein
VRREASGHAEADTFFVRRVPLDLLKKRSHDRQAPRTSFVFMEFQQGEAASRRSSRSELAERPLELAGEPRTVESEHAEGLDGGLGVGPERGPVGVGEDFLAARSVVYRLRSEGRWSVARVPDL